MTNNFISEKKNVFLNEQNLNWINVCNDIKAKLGKTDQVKNIPKNSW